ncbi:MAG: hypothetical protein GY873_02485 [Bosea sp.]|uniref:hypothetical protein n=1 Tax=Bosea sp. (in: a-proteobacteria) TaxID=1871050 RepID=UPI00239012E7|nr:hypothetical protein [Bosea sp. (in: a-proteobacteria)]
MATSASALLQILAQGEVVPTSPFTGGPAMHKLENTTGGSRWAQGTASGQIDRVYMVSGDMIADATDSYDVKAAGSLTDVYGQAIDLDELKGLVLKCLTGTIVFLSPGANNLGCFLAAADGIQLTAGQTLAIDFGAAGLDVTTDSKFDIDEPTSAVATYTLLLWGAQ